MARITNRFLYGAAVVGFLTTISIAGTPVVWHMLGASSHVASELPRIFQEQKSSAVNVDPILAFAPFGAAPVMIKPVKVDTTSLNLQLKGILMGRDQAGSSALIFDGSETATYSVKTEVINGVMLLEIQPDFVTLSVNGDSRRLDFDTLGAATVQTAVKKSDEPYQTEAHRLISASPNNPQTPQEYIDYWRDKIRQNPADVAASIGLVQTNNGYKVANKHDRGVRLAGFKTGDLVTKVNGEKVGNFAKDRKLYDEIAAAGIAKVEFIRDGKPIKLSFPLK